MKVTQNMEVLQDKILLVPIPIENLAFSGLMVTAGLVGVTKESVSLVTPTTLLNHKQNSIGDFKWYCDQILNAPFKFTMLRLSARTWAMTITANGRATALGVLQLPPRLTWKEAEN